MPTTSNDIKANYPIPVYRYLVNFEPALGKPLAFSEVSGLSVEYQTITYKDGLGVKHMPGMGTPVNVTMKKGIVNGDSQLYDWINTIKLNKVDKKDITISLIDESNTPLVTWKVINAFPYKLAAPSFDAYANAVAIESLELLADDLKIANPSV